MSVLLFMPESGGNPLESVIMTTDTEKEHLMPNSRFDLKNGKPVRKLSNDSATVGITVPSTGEQQQQQHPDDVSSLGDDDVGSSSSTSSFRRKPLTRDASSSSAPTNRGMNMPQTHHAAIADAKQPQLRLSPMGAILGATTPNVVKAVNKAQERRILRTRSAGASSQERSQAAVRVHHGFFV